MFNTNTDDHDELNFFISEKKSIQIIKSPLLYVI